MVGSHAVNLGRGSGIQIEVGVRIVGLERKAEFREHFRNRAHLRARILRESAVQDPFFVVDVSSGRIIGDAKIFRVGETRYARARVCRATSVIFLVIDRAFPLR